MSLHVYRFSSNAARSSTFSFDLSQEKKTETATVSCFLDIGIQAKL